MNINIFFACAALFAVSMLRAEPVILRGDRTQITFDGARIVSLKDIPSGTEFSAEAGGPIYKMVFVNNERPALTSLDAEDLKISKDGETVKVSASKHGGLDIKVSCKFSRAEDGSVSAQIEVENNSPKLILGVIFPTVGQKLSLGDNPLKDVLLMPICDGVIVRNPAESDMPSAQYPGNASMQMLARYCESAGVYLASLDSSGEKKGLSFNRMNDVLAMQIINRPEYVPNLKYKSPAFKLDTFSGDWRNAADIYRKWAKKQKWCAKTLKQRIESGDVPAWAAEPRLYFAFDIRRERLGLAAALAEEWANAAGCPPMLMVMSWEKMGPWTTPDYFPPCGGADKITELSKSVHAAKGNTMVFLSGLNWTVKKDEGNFGAFDKTEIFKRDAQKYAIREENGDFLYRKSKGGMGEYSTICPATSAAEINLFDPIKPLVDMGIDCVQADQIVGGGVPTCCAKDHGHPAGGGTWATAAMYKLFEKCRNYGKSLNKDFAWSVEEPGEFFIPVLDIYHARDYIENRWPREGKGWAGVPIFTYVYHEYILGYGGDSSSMKSPYMNAMNLVCGKTPAIAIWASPRKPSAAAPAVVSILREHVRLMREMPDFFVYGRMLKGSPPEVPNVTETINGKEFAAPSVLYARWKNSSGEAIDAYVCISPEPVSFKIGSEKVEMRGGEVKIVRVSK